MGVNAIEQSRPGPPLRARFEIVLIDDEVDPFARVYTNDEQPGVSFFIEHVYGASSDDYKERRYVYLEPVGGETFDQATRRVEAWLSTFSLPPGARFAWEPGRLSAEAGEKRGLETGRTYVLRGAPIITTQDVKRVEAFLVAPGDAAVGVTFTPEAAARFQRATREHLNQRIAIAIDGRIRSAPVIRSEIKGGTVQISLGQPDDPAAALSEAEAFVQQLRTGQTPVAGE